MTDTTWIRSHTALVWAKENETVSLHADAEGWNVYVAGSLRATVGTLAEAKRAAARYI